MLKTTRRGFVAGLAGLVPLAMARRGVFAQDAAPLVLTIAKRDLNVKGKIATVFGLTGPDGKPGLNLLVGERFRTRLVNNTDVSTLIHWHGLTPPVEQDGVPVLSQAPLQPGQSHDYDFPSRRAGTFWMHSHVGLQEQQLLAAPLIVRETDEPLFDDQEHVVLLHDFTFRDPIEILAELKAGGGAHAGQQMGVMLNDVVYDAYLANDRTLDDPEIVSVAAATQVRLRIINGAAASNMWIDLGGLEGELIAVDGNAIHPVKGSLFPLAVAQRADLRLRIPEDGGAFPVLFRPEGVAMRTGIVLATPDAQIAKIPEQGEMAPPLDLSQEMIYRAVAQLPREPVTRTEMLMLMGGEDGYGWSLNGRSGMHDTLFTVRQGERMSIIIHNITAMAHPMHLHGHYFKITAIGKRQVDGALRDVILVPPKETVTVMFDADNPGTWALHCHHAYHMNSGMMGTLAYSNAA